MSVPKWPVFTSTLAPVLSGLVAEQQALGYHPKEAQDFARFDRFCLTVGHESATLPRTLVEQWTATVPGESEANHQRRITLMRVLAQFMHRRGLDAWMYSAHLTPRRFGQYVPYIFTRAEMAALLRAADRCPPDSRSPDRGPVLSTLFRVLYGTGLRVGEALHLQRGDVDVSTGTLYIRNAKGHKDRRVLLHPVLTDRLTRYLALQPQAVASSAVFPNHAGQPYAVQTIYGYFRRFLTEAGITHGGRGQGPRLHDVRYPNLNKTPTFSQNARIAAIAARKGEDFFFTFSGTSLRRMPRGSRSPLSISLIRLGLPHLPGWPGLLIPARG